MSYCLWITMLISPPYTKLIICHIVIGSNLTQGGLSILLHLPTQNTPLPTPIYPLYITVGGTGYPPSP